MSENMQITPALESKIMKLHSRMEQTVAQGRQRQLMTALAMGALLLAGAGYLRYLYSKVAEFAEASTLVELAAAQIEPHLNAEASRFGETLAAQAPTVLDQAEKVVLAAPPQVAREVENYAASFVDKHLVSLESQVYDVVSRTLRDSIVKAREQGVDVSDPRQLDALIDSAGPLMRDTFKKAIDELYAEYTQGADNLTSFVSKLVAAGDGGDLTQLEKSQREILLTGLALIKKIESDPTRAPLRKMIEGR